MDSTTRRAIGGGLVSCLWLLSGILQSCSAPQNNPDIDPALENHACRLVERLRRADWRTIDEDIGFLLRAGVDGVPWLFWAALQLPENTGFSLICRWDECVRDVRELGLHDDYVAMFPYDPWTREMLDNTLVSEGYYLELRWPPAGSTLILNPVKGYERLRGAGSWPRNIRVKQVCHPALFKKQETDGEKAESIEVHAHLFNKYVANADRLQRETHVTMQAFLNQASKEASEGDECLCSSPDEAADGLLYDKAGRIVGGYIGSNRIVSPDDVAAYGSSLRASHIDYLLKAGPSVLPHVFRTWVTTKNCRMLKTWDFCLRKAVLLGFWNEATSFKEALSAAATEGVSRGLLLPIRACEGGTLRGPGSGPETRHSPTLMETISDGSLCVLNPIPVYEQIHGVGTWPSDLPVERIMVPDKWESGQKK